MTSNSVRPDPSTSSGRGGLRLSKGCSSPINQALKRVCFDTHRVPFPELIEESARTADYEVLLSKTTHLTATSSPFSLKAPANIEDINLRSPLRYFLNRCGRCIAAVSLGKRNNIGSRVSTSLDMPIALAVLLILAIDGVGHTPVRR